MNITSSELKKILNETNSDKELRSRIEEISNAESKEKQKFVKMIELLNAEIAKAAGVKAAKIDPNVTQYYSREGLGYPVGGYFICVSASLEYQNVSTIKVSKKLMGEEIVEIYVDPFGPKKAVALAVACVNELNAKENNNA